MEKKIIHVSKNGGIKTITEAQAIAREIGGATVIVEAGVYRESLEFDSRDSGTTYIGEGATLTGGLEIPYADTKDIPDEIKARLSPDAAENVRAIDLTEHGFTKGDWVRYTRSEHIIPLTNTMTRNWASILKYSRADAE